MYRGREVIARWRAVIVPAVRSEEERKARGRVARGSMWKECWGKAGGAGSRHSSEEEDCCSWLLSATPGGYLAPREWPPGRDSGDLWWWG